MMRCDIILCYDRGVIIRRADNTSIQGVSSDRASQETADTMAMSICAYGDLCGRKAVLYRHDDGGFTDSAANDLDQGWTLLHGM
jgi:hypothetical protein